MRLRSTFVNFPNRSRSKPDLTFIMLWAMFYALDTRDPIPWVDVEV